MTDESEFIIHGPKFQFGKPTEPLGTVLLKSMDEFAEDIAFVNSLDGVTETFSSFRKRSICVAENMRSYGIGKGDIISICAMNNVNPFATVMGGILVGAPINGLDVGLSLADLKHLLNLLKPKALFVAPEAVANIEQALSEINLKTILVVYDDEETIHIPFSKFLESKGTEDTFKPVEIDDLKEATAVIICSSGSSGYPKGVMISHYTIVGQITEADLKGGPALRQTFIVFTTIYWMTGLVILLNCLKYGYKRVFFPKPFNEKLALEAIQNYKPTSSLISPSMCNRLVKYPEVTNYDLSSLKLIFAAGGVVPPNQIEKLSQILPNAVVSIAYGMTEICGGIAAHLARSTNYKSTGKLLKGLSAKVVDVETGKLLPRNKLGEVYLKSDYIMKGYYNNPTETAAVKDKDGWIRTGDLGYFDDEDYLYLTDRIKEVLKFQNWPICPSEIESELMTHTEVQECVVVGIPHEVYGDLVLAFVKLLKRSTVTKEELKEYVAARVSDAKKLRGGVIFVENIPILPSGKVNKKYFKTKALEMKELLIANAD